MIVDLYFGRRDQIEYQLGDTCEWIENKKRREWRASRRRGLDGEGYTECPLCGKDFFVNIEVKNDKFISAYPDVKKSPLIPT